MQDGSVLHAPTVISATTPYHTFLELMQGDENHTYSSALPEEFAHHIKHTG